MEIRLNHSFRYKAHNLSALLENVTKLSTLCNHIDKQSKEFPDRYNPDKYKGDAFELFVEALIKLSPIDNRIGISKYEPVLGSDDIGVDGIGIGSNNNPATVQAKYRSVSDVQLTANKDRLTNFTSASAFHYKVKVEDDKNMLVITTASGLHHFTENGEVFTPEHLVLEMLDRIPKDQFEDHTKNFLDNSCGDGNFLVEIVKRKIEYGATPKQALKTTYGVENARQR